MAAAARRRATAARLRALLCTALAAAAAAVNPDYLYASPAAVDRWHDLKFGLRIHWGLYASGVATGTAVGPESWPLNHAQNVSYLREYWAQADNWSPKHYNASQWIDMMKDAGMKYFDFTTKHHEGFSMYDTNANVKECWDFTKTPPGIKACDRPFSSVEAFSRDVVGELMTAAQQGGVLPGLYFSHIDWYDAAMRVDQWNPMAHFRANNSYAPGDDRRAWQRFVLRHRAQITEVLTKYGQVFELSLDMNFPDGSPMSTPDDKRQQGQDMEDTIMLARTLAPNTLFRQRGIGQYGDYSTPEEQFPAQPLPGNWQVIFHGSSYMSYDPVAAHYVNGSFIVWHLVDVVAKGGLMQIGYGPDGNGLFHPKAVDALKYVGGWMRVNSEAIYGTRPMPLRWNDSATPAVRYTRTKDNATIYAIYAADLAGAWPPAALPLACVRAGAAPRKVALLGWSGAVPWSARDGGGVQLAPPAAAPGRVVGPAYAFRLTGFDPDPGCAAAAAEG